MGQETRYLEALQSATTFWIESEKLTLRKAGGTLAATLVRDAPSRPVLQKGDKIRFDLDRLDAQGLQGLNDGLRALHYEYCIPDRPDLISEVTAIDPTLDIQRDSPGRVGCGSGELLCLGHTFQYDYRGVLERLAALANIAEIRESFFE